MRIAFFGDDERLARMSLIDESGERYVRMAHLASVGSHAINGVAALHTELLKSDVLRDFHDLWPEKFSNKTNGVTPRRWMVLCNPRLSQFITRVIGDNWIRHLEELRRLEPMIEDAQFRAEWRDIKRSNKTALAAIIRERTGVTVNPDALFDVQVKRIHEYKRQHLNVLHVIGLYHRLKTDPTLEIHAAHVHLRRQGRARLSPGEADHQADHGGGRRGQSRPGRARPDQGRVPARTSTSPTASASIRRPTCRSRFRPPARRPRAPAT